MPTRARVCVYYAFTCSRGIRAKWTRASFIIHVLSVRRHCAVRVAHTVSRSYLNYYYYYYCRESCVYIFIIYTISHIIIIILYRHWQQDEGRNKQGAIGRAYMEDEDLSLRFMTLLYYIYIYLYIILTHKPI